VDGIVEIDAGRVAGVRRSGIWTFSGIPYAAPPTGRRRFRPPVDPMPWAGVRRCESFGPVAPQPPPMGGLSMTGEPDEHDEDCLTLNLWTPELDGGRRPVLVWVHGGGFTSGSGAGALYRGGMLARDADAVVVTCNYRLGALGFLAHPALADDVVGEPWRGGPAWRGWGNWGLADQVAVLAWIRDNVAGFGGDPGNVTVFGESAGGMSVSALLAVPEARGLFHRAVVQSGPPYTHDASTAAERSHRVAAAAGTRPDRDALLDVPADALVAATTEVGNGLRPGEGIPLALLPVVDGGLLSESPEAAVAAGSSSEVPLLVGTNRDESAFFAVGNATLQTIDDAGVLRWGAAVLGSDDGAAATIAAYRRARARRGEPTSPLDVWVALATDVVFRFPSVRLADAHAEAADRSTGTFAYYFTWGSPLLGGTLGACHALEIPFVFGTVANPAVQLFTGGGDAALELSAAMRRAWGAFARSGVPDIEGPAWPRWSPTERPTMVLGPWPDDPGSLWRPVDRPRHEELAALADVLGGAVPG
jgi:para-nitrobenzyl esterase